MSADIGPGDLVVCVNAYNANPLWCHNLAEGALYKVTGIILGRESSATCGPSDYGLLLDRAQTSAPNGFHPARFRKLEGPPPVFAEMLENNKQPETGG